MSPGTTITHCGKNWMKNTDHHFRRTDLDPVLKYLGVPEKLNFNKEVLI